MTTTEDERTTALMQRRNRIAMWRSALLTVDPATDRNALLDSLVADVRADAEQAVYARLREAADWRHKGPHDTEHGMLRLTARDLDAVRVPGGSNRRDAVARLLRHVADLIE